MKARAAHEDAREAAAAAHSNCSAFWAEDARLPSKARLSASASDFVARLQRRGGALPPATEAEAARS